MSFSGLSWTVASTNTVATEFPFPWRSSAAHLSDAIRSPDLAHDPQPVPTRSRWPLVASFGDRVGRRPGGDQRAVGQETDEDFGKEWIVRIPSQDGRRLANAVADQPGAYENLVGRDLLISWLVHLFPQGDTAPIVSLRNLPSQCATCRD